MKELIKITKQDLLILTKEQREYEDDKNEGLVGFQLIDYEVNFLGVNISGTVDTKIFEDGRQVVFNGDGWLKDGTLID